VKYGDKNQDFFKAIWQRMHAKNFFPWPGGSKKKTLPLTKFDGPNNAPWLVLMS
jgi:hypothetical protein